MRIFHHFLPDLTCYFLGIFSFYYIAAITIQVVVEMSPLKEVLHVLFITSIRPKKIITAFCFYYFFP